jgi:hypothetical protein
MKLKPVFRYDDSLRMVRLFRLLFKRGHPGPGYGAKLSFAVWPKLFAFERGWREVGVTVLGLRVHWLASPGMV